MTKKKRRKRKTSGSSRPAGLIAALGLLAAVAGQAQSRKAQEPFAVIAGSVFKESGFSLAGAEVALAPDAASKPSSKFKKMKAVSDARGEFAFRVPAQPMRYDLVVEAKGYQSQTKPVSIQGEERIDVSFRLVERPTK